MSAYNFGVRGTNITKLLQVTCREAGMMKWVQLFGGPAPLKFGRAKTVRNLVRNFTLDREYLWKG